jgi:hypothetical protein
MNPPQPHAAAAFAAAAGAVQPDAVSSVSSNTAESLLVFDKDEYQYLRKRYLKKRVDKNVELPLGGMRLRRQTKRAAIECYSPGYRSLIHKEIRRLGRHKKNWEIHSILKELYS